MKLIRYIDLVRKGVVHSRPTLKRLIDTQGFPPGFLVTPNARTWDEDEVDAWIAARPVARKASTWKSAPAAIDDRRKGRRGRPEVAERRERIAGPAAAKSADPVDAV
jgi:predicted DNA-binding transcriptional regulator AlpA